MSPVAFLLEGEIVIKEFEVDSCYNVHFRTNTRFSTVMG